MAIVLRSVKGSPLTITEVDGNFTALDQGKLDKTGGTSLYLGTGANNTRFPNALTVISNTASGIQQNEPHNAGLVSEGTASSLTTTITGTSGATSITVGSATGILIGQLITGTGIAPNATVTNIVSTTITVSLANTGTVSGTGTFSNIGVGVYGKGYASGAARSGGVVGEGHVSATGDTGSAIGVRGYANDTHAGGLNIGLYGDATGGASNYALYINRGDVYSVSSLNIVAPSLGLPTGNTAARPGTPASGNLRFNTDLAVFEGYNGTKWGSIGGGGLTPTSIQTANGYTAVANDLVRCNTTAGAFSVTLPASPTDGDIVGFVDTHETFNTYNLTVLAAGSKTIEGDATSLILDMNGTYVALVYNSVNTNWRVLETPTGTGIITTPIKTSAYTALVNDLVRCNTTSASFNVTLPTSPVDGSMVNILDVASTGSFYSNNLTVLPGSGNTIEGDTSLLLDINGAYTSLVYNASGTNWKILQTPYGVLGNVTTSVTLSGLTKGTGNDLSNATAGTDYLAPPSGTALLKANSGGALANASAGTDYVAPGTATTFTKPQTPSTSAETAPSTNAVTWDLTTNQIFRINLNANITTFNLTGTLSSLVGNQYEAIVRYNGGSTISWNANMKWTAATAPTLTGTSGKIDVFTFVVASTDGTNFYLVNTGIKLNVG
jgi:hypothetical protein